MSPVNDAIHPSRIILVQWQELASLRRATLKNFNLDDIHDLRVASRRFRAALETFKPWLPQKSCSILKKHVRELTRSLGGLRNIDEALLFFQIRTPDDSIRGAEICRRLAALRAEEVLKLEKRLTAIDQHHLSRRVRHAAAKLENSLGTTSARLSLTACFSDTSTRLFHIVRELLPDVTEPNNEKPRHALRIAIKKWRYFLEIVATAEGTDSSSLLAQLKDYQTLLGSMNDLAAFGTICAELPLSRREYTFVNATLQAENNLLLRQLTELITQRPLVV